MRKFLENDRVKIIGSKNATMNILTISITMVLFRIFSDTML